MDFRRGVRIVSAPGGILTPIYVPRGDPIMAISQKRAIWLCAALAVCGSHARSAEQSLSDPRALIEGLRATRSAIISGQVQMEYRLLTSKSPTVVTARLDVDFDGVKRTTVETARIVVTKQGLNEKARELFAKMNNDLDAYVKAGYGDWKVEVIKHAWDGSRLCRHSELLRASYIDPAPGTGDLCFDPRVLGLSVEYFFDDDVAKFTTFKDQDTKELVGREVVNGASTWHIRVRRASDGLVTDLWIEPPIAGRDAYRVHKRQTTTCSVESIGF
jgi:hypothetical protein